MPESAGGAPRLVLLTFSDYARHRGVTQQRVSQLVAQRRIPVVDTVDGRRIIPEQADAALDRTADPSQSKPKGAPAVDSASTRGLSAGAPGGLDPQHASGNSPGGVVPPTAAVPAGALPSAPLSPSGPGPDTTGGNASRGESFADARTATERIRAKVLEAQYRREVGELVEADKVDAGVRDVALNAAKILDAMADRYAGPFAAESDVRRMRALIIAATDDVKRAIAAGATQLAGAEATATPETRQ